MRAGGDAGSGKAKSRLQINLQAIGREDQKGKSDDGKHEFGSTESDRSQSGSSEGNDQKRLFQQVLQYGAKLHTVTISFRQDL